MRISGQSFEDLFFSGIIVALSTHVSMGHETRCGGALRKPS